MVNIIKQIIPPFFINCYKILNSKKIKFYSDWQEALVNSKGYDSQELINKLLLSAKFVYDGEKAFERDGITFDKLEFNWPLLSSILYSTRNNNNCILDFGGGFGSTYFQHKNFLDFKPELKWIVLEQKGIIKLANQNFNSETLIFSSNINEVNKFKPQTLLLSSVLHYLEDPYKELKGILSIASIKYIVIDRTPFFCENSKSKIVVQKVKNIVYKTSYPHWIFNAEQLLSFFRKNKFKIFTEWEAIGDKNKTFSHKGFLLVKKII